jgi:hypothetical protein
MKAPEYQQPASLLSNKSGAKGDQGFGLADQASQADIAAIQAQLRGDTASILARYGQRRAFGGGAASPLLGTG